MGIGGALMPGGTRQRAVFLDRDGVINRAVVRSGKPYPPASVAELEILPRVPEALSRIRDAGFMSIVVTNQPDVARGTTSMAEVEAINAALAAKLPIDEFNTCYHDGNDNCECRKPKPGMLLQAARKWRLDLATSYMVGDRWRDIEAGQRAGCRTVFIDYGYDEKQPEQYDYHVTSLWEAADIICSK
jgi:D-glycero-D-manno-heptose 1,7-bisphosphate phosphatase